LQATLPDLEKQFDALKKEKEDAESAWKLSISSAASSSSALSSDDAADNASSGSISDGGQGIKVDNEASSADSSLTSVPDAASSQAVAQEPIKPQELLDIEVALKEADSAKRSHER
jgi:hypothetical protein